MKKLIVICGPTAVGKTSTSIALAKHLNCEIISCDSRQFFKEMSIGTAKPTIEEMDGIPHHFVGNLSIQEEYTAGRFEEEAIKKIAELHKTNEYVIMVGGSGLYVKAVVEGIDNIPGDSKIREELNLKLENEGIEVLQNQLKELDEDHYKTMDIHNTQRLVRAIEVCLTTGQSYSSLRLNEKKNRDFETDLFCINMDRDKLYERINLRVDLMLESGLLDEVKSLEQYKHINALKTVGYQEFYDSFDGKHNLEEAVELVKRNSRRYAKRQLTWFKRMGGIEFLEKDEALNELLNKYSK